MNKPKMFTTRDDIQNWLISVIARSLKINPEDVDTSVAFHRYGMDSVVAVEITGDLEKCVDQSLPPTLMYDYPTIDALSEYIAEQLDLQKDGVLAGAV